MSSPRAAIGFLLASLAAAIGLAACGGDGESTSTAATSPAEQLCRDYRLAVTAVRVNGSPEEKSADLAAAADAARAALEDTSAEDLSTGGEDYLQTLDELASAYDAAATALTEGSKADYFAGLDRAEPADDALDGLAGDAGFASCALGEVAADEQGVSQSGFPALAVPADAVPVPPQGNTITYTLPAGAIRLIDIGPAAAGTVDPAESAASFEQDLGGEFEQLDQVGESGNELVPTTEFHYAYDNGGSGTVPGIAHVFSGQGEIWALDCAGSEPATEVTPELQTACERAVETLGFLIF